MTYPRYRVLLHKNQTFEPWYRIADVIQFTKDGMAFCYYYPKGFTIFENMKAVEDNYAGSVGGDGRPIFKWRSGKVTVAFKDEDFWTRKDKKDLLARKDKKAAA